MDGPSIKNTDLFGFLSEFPVFVALVDGQPQNTVN